MRDACVEMDVQMIACEAGMRAEALAVRDGRAVVTTNCRANEGIEAVAAAIAREALFRE